MRGDRPQNLLAMAVASLLLALAIWWAWGTFSGEEATKAERAQTGLPPSWLEPDPPAAKPEPKSLPPAQPDRGPALNPPKPPTDAPPERIQPEVLPPSSEPEPGAEPAFLPPDDREKEPETKPDFSTDAFRARLLGGVARVSARATPEVRVRRGDALIGSSLSYVRGLAGAARVSDYVGLAMEAPVHRVRLDEFFIDRFEVRNHDYLVYLNRTARIRYDTSDHPDRTLAEIVAYLVPDRPSNTDATDIAAYQMFQANRLALVSAWSGLVVKNRDGVIDLEKTYERVRERAVPRGVRLVFYDRLPPGHWPSAVYDTKRVDYPVRDVSLEEALTYALYRGRHIPTEQQWEYAARGPNGLAFPWDPRGKDFLFNVNGGREPPRGLLPETRPVTQYPGGASWIGVFNMLGNVSEWTSSYLDRYPGGWQDPDLVPGTNIVVRGGSVNDRERWGLRPMRRGWLAGDPDGAPRTNVRRTWTGIRTARWEEPARSRIPTMQVRARSRTRIDRALLEPRIFMGWEGEQFTTFERVAGEDNRDKPSPGVKSVVAQPLHVVSVRDPGTGRHVANPDGTISDPSGLLRASLLAPVYLGLLHIDMHLLDMWVDADEGAFYGGGPTTRFRRADMRPGTYFVALVHGFVAFVRTDLREVYFPSNRPPPRATFNVIERAYPAGKLRRPTVDVDFDGAKRVSLTLVVPTHTDAEPGMAAMLRLRLSVDPRDTRLVREFKRGRIRR